MRLYECSTEELLRQTKNKCSTKLSAFQWSWTFETTVVLSVKKNLCIIGFRRFMIGRTPADADSYESLINKDYGPSSKPSRLTETSYIQQGESSKQQIVIQMNLTNRTIRCEERHPNEWYAAHVFSWEFGNGPVQLQMREYRNILFSTGELFNFTSIIAAKYFHIL